MTQAFQTELVAAADLPDVCTLRIRGRVEYSDVSAFRARILDHVARTDAPRFVLELGEVERIDTAGAAVMVEALLAAREKGVQVLFCSPSESVMQLFRLAGFEDVLGRCCPTPADTARRLRE